MTEDLLQFATTHIHLAPWVIFGLLLLAGFNVPVSEDVMLFISAVLAKTYPDYLTALFLAVYLGAYLSDVICYSLGRILGPKLWNIKFFAKMVDKEKIKKVSHYYENYGTLTLILGRFIPFGVRNALFLTAGLGRMSVIKFMLSDLLACTISCFLFFNLYFHFGQSMIEYVKKANIVIFALALITVFIIIWCKRQKQKKKSLG